MKRPVFCLLFLAVMLLIFQAQADGTSKDFDMSGFARLPVQDLGRVEPMDSFARATLATVSGRFHIDGMTASAWLAELLFDPEAAYERRSFFVASASVRQVLGLPDREKRYYTFPEISAAIARNKPMVDALLARSDLDPAQAQTVALYNTMLLYFDITRSFSMVLKLFVVDDPASAKSIGVKPGAPFDYLAMDARRGAYLKLVQPLLPQMEKEKSHSARNAELLQVGVLLQQMDVDKKTSVLRIMPPVWKTGGETWLSPWGVLQEGQGSPQGTILLESWGRLAEAYRAGDKAAWQRETATVSRQTLVMATGHMRPAAVEAEYRYNRIDPFRYSLALYLAALGAMVLSYKKPSPLKRAVYPLMVSGAAIHAAGIGVRMFILQRPPVATLYESIVFAGLVAVLAATVAARKGGRETLLASGLLAGIVLHMIGMAYAADGRSMGTLTAVLNTNFWLATHVVMVTSGYGCCLILGLLAHIDLAQRVFAPDGRRQDSTARTLAACSLAALFFAATGTILGGIWADQSWGRFWGWDPKENGALLVVLWLLWLLHGRFSGVLKPLSFTVCAALTVVIVALSWFGVNLLNVGLHSYGFTADIASNLGAFIAAELVYAGGCLFILKQREKTT